MTTIIRRRAGDRDRNGDLIPGTGGDVPFPPGSFIAPRSSAESTNLRNTVIVGLALYTPYAMTADVVVDDAYGEGGFGAGEYGEGAVETIALDIIPTDQIVIEDSPHAGVYEVEGQPGHWENPFTSWQAGSEVALKKVTG